MITYVRAVQSAEEIKSIITSARGKKLQNGEADKGGNQNIVVNPVYLADTEEKELREACRSAGISYIRINPEDSIGKGFNEALKVAKGDFICFTYGNVDYDSWTDIGIEAAAVNFPDANFFEIEVSNKEKAPEDLKRDLGRGEIKYLDDLDVPSFRIYNFFVKTDLATILRFKELTDEDMNRDFCIRLLSTGDGGQVVSLPNITCYPGENVRTIFDKHVCSNEKEYYIPVINESYLPILKETVEKRGSIPKWMQLSVFYGLNYKLHENLNNANKLILSEDEAAEFLNLTGEVSKYLDDDVIMDNVNYKKPGIRFIVRNMLCHMKYDGDEEALGRRFVLENEKIGFIQRGIKYNLSRDRRLVVKTMHIEDNSLIIVAWFMTHMIYEFDPEAIYAEVNGVRTVPEHKDYYALDKVFGKAINKRYVFRLRLPLEDLFKQNSKIIFYMEVEGRRASLPLDFNRAPSKLSNDCDHRYWPIGDSHIAEYSDECIWISQVTANQLKTTEEKYQRDAIRSIRKLRHEQAEKAETRMDGTKIKVYGRLEGRELVKLRNQYYAEKERDRDRRIWLYFDKLYKAGDNGEYAFRYAYNNDKSIESYYVINKDAPDYKRLKQEFGDRILIFGDFKTKLYALLAETVVATHPDIIEFFGYKGHDVTLMKNLFNPYLVCIAHGVTIQKNADYQNKLFDNTMFYTTSSKYEVEHILKPIYGYEESEVALTGMARFDGLVNRDKKQILITPTWRRSLVGRADRNSTREYNDEFKNTDYYHIYNSLINDERLIESAKKNGYRIIFLLHPSMSTQIDDYDKNESVDIIPASGDMSYEKILTESSLMVTDYSGIHYDFGYMRKPVIYYQPKEVPMRFEEGGMKFATMGFGPVCTEYEDAVRLITEYMDNQCKMPEEYKLRADDFFAFSDHNNSMRIHDAIKKWVDERNRGNSLIVRQ